MAKTSGFWSVCSLPSLLLATVILVTGAYQSIGAMVLRIGIRDLRFIQGMHAVERLEASRQLMRWSSAQSRIDLPLPASLVPVVLSINLMHPYPEGVPNAPMVTIRVGERMHQRFIPERASRFYRILLPPQEPAWWGLSVNLESTTMRPPTDARDLGVVILGASLAATNGFPSLPPRWQVVAFLAPGHFPLIPPWWQLVAFTIGATALYGGIRGIGAAHWLAWLLTLGIVGIVTGALAKLPMEIAPYTMRLAGLASLGGIIGLASRLLGEPFPQPAFFASPPRGFRIPFKKLLILMTIAYWLMPVYQLIMTADGVKAVAPYPPTLWVAAAAGWLLMTGFVFLADSHRLRHWARWVIVVSGFAALAHLIVMLEFVMANSGVAMLTVSFGLLWVVATHQRRAWVVAIAGVITMVAIVSQASRFDTSLGRSGPDFWILFKGAREWFRGGSLYDLQAVRENHFGHVFKVPPFYGMLFVPFVQQDGLMILFWHRIINMTILMLTMLILLRELKIALFSAMGAGILLVFNTRAIADTVAYGQIDILLLLLLTLALFLARRGCDGWAGAAIALATLFKLYPALLLAFFLVKRQWRAFIGFGIAMLVCNGIALAVMGWEMHRIYLFEVIPAIGGGTAWVENQTLNGFVSRIFASSVTATIYHHPTVSLITYIGFGVGVGGAMLLSLWRAERTSIRYALQFSLYILLLVLVVPAAWIHYQTILILPWVIILLTYSQTVGVSRWLGILVALAYSLLSYGNQWSFYTGHIMGGLTVFGISFKFYGMLLLLLVIILGIVSKRMQPISQGISEPGSDRGHSGHPSHHGLPVQA